MHRNGKEERTRERKGKRKRKSIIPAYHDGDNFAWFALAVQ
jgi:hypothetical protein